MSPVSRQTESLGKGLSFHPQEVQRDLWLGKREVSGEIRGGASKILYTLRGVTPTRRLGAPAQWAKSGVSTVRLVDPSCGLPHRAIMGVGGRACMRMTLLLASFQLAQNAATGRSLYLLPELVHIDSMGTEIIAPSHILVFKVS